MGLFQPNFNKPGKGVDENAPQKRDFFRFWEVLGRKSGKLLKTNLLYSLALLPTFLLIMVLTGLVTSPVLSADSVRGFIRNIAELNASAMETTPAELEIRLCVTLDVVGRLVLSYLFTILWGMGPVTAGVTYVWRNFSREEHAWIFSDFKDALKENWKQSLAVFGIDAVFLILCCLAIRVYSGLPGIMGMLQYVIWILIFLDTLMHFYLYPMMVTYRLSLKNLYKNSFLFAIGKLPSNLLVLIILLLVHLGPIYLIIQYSGGYFALFLFFMWVLEAVFLLSFSGFLVNFHVNPKLKKYMQGESEETEMGDNEVIS